MVIQVNRFSDGARRVTSIAEITGMEQDVITMQEIFVFEKTGVNESWQGGRPLPRHRHPSEVRGEAAYRRIPAADGDVRARHTPSTCLTAATERVRSFR